MNENKISRISVKNICKKFNLSGKKSDNALSGLLSSISGKDNSIKFEAIKDISFELFAGEKLGLIGGNGSGKSSLLRIIAGIYRADSGTIKSNGNVIYINGFGIGLKHRLSMRDNIYLVASIMGLSHKEINKRFDEIVAFSELEEFIDTKIYQFSYGMIMRLCFSISMHCLEYKENDILLLDEVFGSGGDFAFEKKAIAKMESLIKQGASFVIVSHNLETITKYCDRVILLDEGKIIREGESSEIVNAYKNSNL